MHRFTMQQIAISNPNRKVLLTLSRAGLIELIGKRWYFVSVHDAVKACLQHMQSFHGPSPRAGDLTAGRQQGFLQRLWKQDGDESKSDQEPLLPPKEVWVLRCSMYSRRCLLNNIVHKWKKYLVSLASVRK